MKRLTFIFLFLLCFVPSVRSSGGVKITFWASSYFFDTNNEVYAPITGHFSRDAFNAFPTGSFGLVPAGAITFLTCTSNQPTVGNSDTFTAYVNGSSTAASCTFSDLQFTCSWSGSVTVSEDAQVNILKHHTGPDIHNGPQSCILILTVSGGDDWPWTV